MRRLLKMTLIVNVAVFGNFQDALSSAYVFVLLIGYIGRERIICLYLFVLKILCYRFEKQNKDPLNFTTFIPLFV